MATWNALSEYVRRNYEISEETDSSIRLVFNVADLRSQVVMLWRQNLNNGQEEWVQIESAFGHPNKVDLVEILNFAGGLVVGGVVIEAEMLVYRHSVPLLNMDINEFERPLKLVLTTADRMERDFSGTDIF